MTELIDLKSAASLWAAVAATASALMAFLAWRVSRRNHLLSLPYIEASRNSALQPGFVWVSLAGPSSDAWQIDLVRLIKPKRAQFLTRVDVQDQHGGFQWQTGAPLGPVQHWRSNPLIVDADSGPLTLKVRLSLKASPQLRGWRTFTVGSAPS